jgi:GT2 family glycosyltransferase
LAWTGKISALVLTYNRKEILSQCLKAILGQVEPADEVVVLDNGSTDGTCEYLQESGFLEHARIVLYRHPENIGPAAGADTLFRLAKERGSDWLWCMNDDTLADPDALAELKRAYAANFSDPQEVGFLTSVVMSADGTPNGLPEVDLRAAPGQSPSWADRLGSGLVKVRWSTLNSTLIPRSTLISIGNIRSDFFFAGEDIDFTFRTTDVLPGYLVGKSKATHLCAVSGRFSSLLETDPKRIRLGLYYYRNNLYFRWRYYSFGRVLLYVGKCFYEAVLALGTKTYPLTRSTAIMGGLLWGLFFFYRHPRAAGPLSSKLQRPPVQLSGSPPPVTSILA